MRETSRTIDKKLWGNNNLTRQAQAVSALITQFQLAESSIESMASSSGKAMELNNIIMDTAAKKTAQLRAEWEKFSASAVDSSIFKMGLDGLREFVKLLTAVNSGTGGMLSMVAAIIALSVAGKSLSTAKWFEPIKNLPRSIASCKITRNSKIDFLGYWLTYAVA